MFTGYIGLEVAASCAARGMNPAVVMMEPHVMARLWSPEIAAHYENLYESKGTTFHKNAKVKAINKGPDGAVESVELEGGVVIPADLVIVGVGAGAVTAPFDALESTPERFPGGIKVDGTFAASGAGVEPKSVYAIGDIAAFPLAFDGNQIVRMEHVAHARASATHAAECILADSETPYAYTPYFYSRVFEQVSFYFDLRMGDNRLTSCFVHRRIRLAKSRGCFTAFRKARWSPWATSRPSSRRSGSPTVSASAPCSRAARPTRSRPRRPSRRPRRRWTLTS